MNSAQAMIAGLVYRIGKYRCIGSDTGNRDVGSKTTFGGGNVRTENAWQFLEHWYAGAGQEKGQVYSFSIEPPRWAAPRRFA